MATPQSLTAPVPSRWARIGDITADTVVAGLAWGTLVVHVALVLEWTRPVVLAVLIAGAPAVLALAVVTSHHEPAAPPPVAPPTSVALPWVVIGLAVAVATAVVEPVGGAFVLVWAAIVFTGLGLTAVRRRGQHPTAPEHQAIRRRDLPDAAVWALAGVAAVGSLIILRPDADDVELVNRSVAVEADSGTLPTRDTVLSDEVYAGDRPEPATTVEPLLGLVAAVVPWTAPTVVYLWWGPLVAGVSVIALWRLLRTLGAPTPVLATAVACAWLFLDGAEHSSLGNFWIARSWQGKVALLVVVVPVLWHHALAFARHGRATSLAMSVACGVAAVGLSRTGVLIVPLVVAAVIAAAALEGRWRRSGALLAAVSYPAGAGLFSVLANPESITPLRPGGVLAAAGPIPLLSPTDAATPWYTVLGTGVGLAVGLGAALAAGAIVVDRLAGTALAVAPAVVALTVSTPGAAQQLDDSFGIDAITWRAIWALPVVACVGLLVCDLAARLAACSTPKVAAAVPLGALVALGLDAGPLVDTDNMGARWHQPTWKVDQDGLEVGRRVIELTEQGGLVAMPLDASTATASTTIAVRVLVPRPGTLEGRQVVPELLATERLSLTFSLETGTLDAIAEGFARRALDGLPVSTVCSRPAIDDDNGLIVALRDAGFTEVGRDEHCVLWRRGP